MDLSILQQFLDQQIEKGVPGCELAVCQDHQILFHGFAGHSDYEKTTPTTAEDRYLLYSCTKPMTAAAAMICLERGFFCLDDPVSDYLPAYQNAFLLQDGMRRKPASPITVRHLLTMTAGLNYKLNTPSTNRVMEHTGNHATTRQLVNAFIEEPLDFEPGSQFLYSLCLDVMGGLIETVSGCSLSDFFQQNIWTPLGMNNTYFYRSDRKDSLVAAQYRYNDEKNAVVPWGVSYPLVLSPEFESGGAGLVSTVSDYLRFADALACGDSILSPDFIDLMRTPHLSSFRPEDKFGCMGGPDYGYGLGVRTRIRSDHGVPSSIGEFGWDGAAGADVLIDPEHRLSFFYVQHVLNWPALQGAIHLQIRDLLYPALGIG